MQNVRFFHILIAALVLLFAGTASANCNKRKQKFELPNPPPTAKPFQFEDPDPVRRIPEIAPAVDVEGKTVFLVGISGNFSPNRIPKIQEGVIRLFTNAMCRPQDVMLIYDGATMNRIATLVNSDRIGGCDEKYLKHKLDDNNRGEIVRLNQHFAAMDEKNHKGAAEMDVPRVTHQIGQVFHNYPDFPNRILVLFGSAIHRSGNNSLADAYPTVGMLRATTSEFSTREKSSYLGNTMTHFVVNEEDFVSMQHRLGLQNWWSAWFLSQGSPLLTFNSDPRVAERVLNAELPAIPAYVDDLNPGFVLINQQEFTSVFGDMGDKRSLPSPVRQGTMTIGLMWDDAAVDLDLHIGLAGQGGDRLSFRNPRTPFGSLRKQPAKGWEEVTLNGEYRPEAIEVWVNFFDGESREGAKGELRVSYAGQLFRQQIVFSPDARKGNRGAQGSAAHWVDVDLRSVVSGRN